MTQVYSPTVRNSEVAQIIAAQINGDEIDAIDWMMTRIEQAGWVWEKQENSYGHVRDGRHELHILWAAQSFADAVVEAYRLLLQFQARGWA